MKAKYWILIVAFVVIGVGLGIYFFTRKSKDLAVEDGKSSGCIKTKKSFAPWDEFASTDWGNYAQSIEEYLDIPADDKQSRALVEGFLKGADLAARSEYIRYYKKDILKYLDSPEALPHWSVEAGSIKCT